MRTVCKSNQCTGCSACVNICHKGAIQIHDELSAYNAVIDESLCVNCNQCERVCPSNNLAKKTKPALICQGWARDEDIRAAASSGGVATAMAASFVKNGGVVCSCKFDDGKFVFDIADSLEDIKKFTGSKYVKSNPLSVLKKIKALVKDGRRVLFIGLPCQVAGLKNYVGGHENLYTVDLICHGSPSPRILEKFLEEKGRDITKMENIKFRNKTEFSLFDGEKGIEPKSVKDRYTYAFLGGLCYTENCYSCPYASLDRVSDVTLGDSWGSELPIDENKKGISLILCQSDKGKELVEGSELCIYDVDAGSAIEHNGQLKAPSKMPAEHDIFFSELKKHGSVNKAIRKCYPKTCLRQDVKAFLIKAHIIRR